MNSIKNLFSLYKTYGKEVQLIKIIALVTINTWLLIIFWKILLVENVNVMGNNVALNKMQTALSPVLQILGLDMLSPSVIKLLIVSTIVLTANLLVLNTNGMLATIGLLGITRYGYKSYTNYLINLENMSKTTMAVPQIPMKVVEKSMEQAPIVINTGGTSSTNWMLWGTVIIIGALAVGAIVFTMWSHETNLNNITEANSNIKIVNNGLGNVHNDISNRIDDVVDAINKNDSTTVEIIRNVNIKTNIIDEKTTYLEQTVDKIGKDLTKVAELNNNNVLELSKQSLKLSQEAKNAMLEISEASTTAEAATLGVAKLWELVKEYGSRLEILENKTGVATPRPSSLINNYKSNEY